MGGGKGGSQTIGFRYYMSLHMGLCRGPIDELVQIKVGDLRAWPVAEGDSTNKKYSFFEGIFHTARARDEVINLISTGSPPWPDNEVNISAIRTINTTQLGSRLNVDSMLTMSAVNAIKLVRLSALFSLVSEVNPSGGGNPSGKEAVAIAHGPNGNGVTIFTDGGSLTVEADLINTASATGRYTIDAASLFGGDKKEGGIAGSLELLKGSLSQTVPGWIKTLMGGRVPDFRGVSTLFYDGLLTSLNPYPKKWEFRVRRTTSGWDGAVWQPSLATIWMRDGTIKAMNPAHIMYECLTNRDWGRGMSRTLLLEAEWLNSAQTLFDENFGLCLRYTRQSELSSFIQDILDHIGGSIYPDRQTGKLALSLIRDDYDLEALPLFTYDTGLIALEDEDSASQEDVVNECIVKWRDPLGKEERSARVQNIASRQSTGAVNSTTTNYAGVPTVDLALRLAQRDLKAGATSLKRYKLVLDRRAWRIVPGDAFRISVPQKGIYNAVLRAGKVTEGGHDDGRISVEAVIDVFGLPSSSYISPEQGVWTPPDRTVSVAEKRVVREATYVEVFYALDQANLNILPVDAGTIATVVGRPSALTQAYDLQVIATGETTPRSGVGTFAPYVISSAAIPLEAGPTLITFNAASDVGLIAIGSMVQLGNEICRLEAIDVEPGGYAGTITVARGCVDTIPQEHPIGSTIYFVTDDEVGGDGKEYVTGEIVNVKVLPYSSSNNLDPTLVEADTVHIVGRQGRPYPPGNLRVNGTPYGEVASVDGDIVISWSHRDRVIQQDRLVDHTQPTIGPEAGTSYRVSVFKGDTHVAVRTATGITGTSFSYTESMATADGITTSVWFEIDAVRGGLPSTQKYRFGLESDFPAPPVITPLLEVSEPDATMFIGGEFTRIPFYDQALNIGTAFIDDEKWTVPETGTYRIRLDVAFAGASTPLIIDEAWDLKIDDFEFPTAAPVLGQSASGIFNGTAPASLDVTVELTSGQVLSAYLRTDQMPHITVTSALWRIEHIIN